jgi:hypothetical protein
VLAATVPAVAVSTEVTKAFYGDTTLPMFALVDVPMWANIFAVLLVSVLTDAGGVRRLICCGHHRWARSSATSCRSSPLVSMCRR